MTDIVIPFINSINRDEELRYTLRSIEKFVPDAGEVFIWGDEPRWSHDLPVVYYNHKKRGPEWKEYNQVVKLLEHCESLRKIGVEKDFYIFHDDNFLLREWSGEAYHCGEDWNGRGYYAETEANTRQLFPSADNWDLHGPHKVNSQLFRRSVGALDWTKPYGYCIKTVYHYMNGLDGEYLADLKFRGDEDASFLNKLYIYNEEGDRIRPRPFFSISDEAYRYDGKIRSLLKYLYPNKSRWEL